MIPETSMELSRRKFSGATVALSLGLLPRSDGQDSNTAVWPTVQGNPAHTGYCRSGQGVPATGDVAWTVDVDDEIRASPVVSDGAVVVATMDGRVIAFELTNGTKRWEREGTAEIWREPTVDADTVYVNLDEQSIHALNLQTGETRWQTDVGFWVSINGGPLLVNDTLYVNAGSIYAIDLLSGEIRWKSRPEATSSFGLAIRDGRIFLANTMIAEALDTHDGSQLWTAELQPRVSGLPTIANDVYFPSLSRNVISAVSKETGDVRWQFTVTDEIADVLSASPIVAGDMIIAADRLGNVAGATKSNGEVQWRHTVDGLLDHHPVACQDVVYLPTDEGVVALSIPSGEVLWRTEVGEYPTSPAIADDRVLVTTRDGTVTSLGETRGRLTEWVTGPGFGIGAGLAGLGGYAAYKTLRRRE